MKRSSPVNTNSLSKTTVQIKTKQLKLLSTCVVFQQNWWLEISNCLGYKRSLIPCWWNMGHPTSIDGFVWRMPLGSGPFRTQSTLRFCILPNKTPFFSALLLCSTELQHFSVPNYHNFISALKDHVIIH